MVPRRSCRRASSTHLGAPGVEAGERSSNRKTSEHARSRVDRRVALPAKLAPALGAASSLRIRGVYRLPASAAHAGHLQRKRRFGHRHVRIERVALNTIATLLRGRHVSRRAHDVDLNLLTSPAGGGMRKVVLLPQPRVTSTMNSPASMRRSTRTTGGLSPKRLVTDGTPRRALQSAATGRRDRTRR